MSKAVRSVSRALEVLGALNERNYSTALMLSRQTGIPRGTVYRLLDTLAEAGFVDRVSHETFCLTGAVRRLSKGLTPEAIATEMSCPLADAMSRETGWPFAVFALDADDMVIRYSTNAQDVMTLVSRASVGAHVPLLRSAPGKIFVAALPEAEREARVNRVCVSEGLPFNAQMTEVEDARRCGFGLRVGGIIERTIGLAVAVRLEGRPLICLSGMFMQAALSPTQVVERYASALLAAADRIERRLPEALGLGGHGAAMGFA